MPVEDLTTPWIEEVLADLSLVDLATVEEPIGDADDDEVTIGELPSELRRLYVLTMQAEQDCDKLVRRAKTNAEQTGDLDLEIQEAFNRAKNYFDAIDGILEVSLCESFAAWNDRGIGIVAGWNAVVPVRSKITEWRTPIRDVHWLVCIKEELVKIPDEKILRPFRTDERGKVVGNIRGIPGVQRLYTLREHYHANKLRARANFFEAPRDNNHAEVVTLIEWNVKQKCVGLMCSESLVHLLDHPFAKPGNLSLRPNWDVIWTPPDDPDESEDEHESDHDD